MTIVEYCYGNEMGTINEIHDEPMGIIGNMDSFNEIKQSNEERKII